jgi:hypothetical protein
LPVTIRVTGGKVQTERLFDTHSSREWIILSKERMCIRGFKLNHYSVFLIFRRSLAIALDPDKDWVYLCLREEDGEFMAWRWPRTQARHLLAKNLMTRPVALSTLA